MPSPSQPTSRKECRETFLSQSQKSTQKIKAKEVIVKLLDTDGANLPQALSKFNAANARCYLDADRQKLLAVVESSFGTFQPFNKLVRQIMRQKLTESQKLNDLTAAIEQSVVRSQRDGSVRV